MYILIYNVTDALSIIFVNCHYDSYFFIVLSCLLQNCEGYNIDYSMFVDFYLGSDSNQRNRASLDPGWPLSPLCTEVPGGWRCWAIQSHLRGVVDS